MESALTLFRGTRGDNILQAITEGLIRPGADHKVWFSRIVEDALKHGGDIERRETYAFKAIVTIPPGASVNRTAVHGNPLSVLITSSLPVPVKLLEMYVRRPNGDRLETIAGAAEIKAYLIRARSAAAEVAAIRQAHAAHFIEFPQRSRSFRRQIVKCSDAARSAEERDGGRIPGRHRQRAAWLMCQFGEPSDSAVGVARRLVEFDG